MQGDQLYAHALDQNKAMISHNSSQFEEQLSHWTFYTRNDQSSIPHNPRNIWILLMYFLELVRISEQ
jgi:hypothetical protein